MCIVVIFPASKCRCSDARGASFVDPRLGLELSIQWSVGSLRESITALKVCLPVAKLKKFGRQALRVGSIGACGIPRVKRAMHFCEWIGAWIPETTIRVGGVRSVVSATMSFHFVSWVGICSTSFVKGHATPMS